MHRLDAAGLFRLAVEHAPGGSALHGGRDEGVPIRAIAEVMGADSNLPVAGVALENAAAAVRVPWPLPRPRQPGLERGTRELLGWSRPAGLIDDLGEGHYFLSPASVTRPS